MVSRIDGTNDIEAYLEVLVSRGLYSSRKRLRFHMEMIFRGIDFCGKNVLDIGGGRGLYSFYAALMGAGKVVCLEPEAAGSTVGVTSEFNKLKSLLNCNNVELLADTLQNMNMGEKFDIVMLIDSINHLDETACANLLEDVGSRDVYRGLLMKIYGLSDSGAKLIVCDCSRYNFFDLIKIRNPFAPSIEWHKHQSPKVWIELLSELGFVNPRVRWSSFNRLYNWGKLLTGNKVAAYFLTSHFCLTMDKQ